MSWRTSGLIVSARNVGRILGLNRWIASYLHGQGYEMKYDTAFSEKLKVGDCVWDVGANVGYYTQLFAERVGVKGSVIAFEPSPTNFARLRGVCAKLSNVKLIEAGLGREDGTVSFQQGTDDLGATSRVVEPECGGVIVKVHSARNLIEAGSAALPNAMKIDVEGFEYEVLEGFGERLGEARLQLIGIEVHFGILKERGMANAPKQIEELLKRHGFTVIWPDSSHILATRDR
jgi:FkbM family methyltransferase